MDFQEHAHFVAQNPGPAALFFDAIITAFIDIILGYGNKDSALFGKCEAYYGKVDDRTKVI
jgi:hypothetical protein